MISVPMTKNGIEKLRKELNYLKNIRRPEIIKNISDARSYGDLKENAEYHAAREQQGFCEGRIQEIELKLFHAYVVDLTKVPPSDIVVFGSKIEIENIKTMQRSTYRIVGDDEADLKENMISVHSPIARGLIGKKSGDVVIINTPQGEIEYRIMNVQYC